MLLSLPAQNCDKFFLLERNRNSLKVQKKFIVLCRRKHFCHKQGRSTQLCQCSCCKIALYFGVIVLPYSSLIYFLRRAISLSSQFNGPHSLKREENNKVTVEQFDLFFSVQPRPYAHTYHPIIWEEDYKQGYGATHGARG